MTMTRTRQAATRKPPAFRGPAHHAAYIASCTTAQRERMLAEHGVIYDPKVRRWRDAQSKRLVNLTARMTETLAKKYADQ